MVRCSQNRDATRYDAECINARQAVQQIEAKDEAANRVDMEARSEAKRQALRRTQQAAAQARRRAAESARLREEAEYLAQFGVAPPKEGETDTSNGDMGNTPIAVIPEAELQADSLPTSGGQVVTTATDGGNAPVSAQEPEKTDLESIRDELQRRKDEGEN